MINVGITYLRSNICDYLRWRDWQNLWNHNLQRCYYALISAQRPDAILWCHIAKNTCDASYICSIVETANLTYFLLYSFHNISGPLILFQLEVEDTPPPLAPKKSSLIGFQDAKGGGRESRLGLEGRGGGRDSRVAAYDGRHGSSVLHADNYGRGSCLQRHSLPSDVQLTTIYPPPRRFEL